MTIWVTGDEHYNHANVLAYCDRPFKDTREMNQAMLDRMRAVVGAQDIVYHVGDFAFYGGTYDRMESGATDMRMLIAAMPGRHVFIMGNHDRGYSKDPRIKQVILDMYGMEFRLLHHPEEAPKDGRINLTGHVHGAWLTHVNAKGARCYNVGVDMHNFAPVQLGTIAKYYRKLNKSLDRPLLEGVEYD